jgi:hypothetical protein
MTAQDPPEPTGQVTEDGCAVNVASSPVPRERSVLATQQRLKRFRSDHPDVEIVAHGYWQAANCRGLDYM